MRLDKYLKANSHHVSIQKNETHRENTSLQLKKNNQTVLTLIKNTYVHEWSKHINITYHYIQDLHKRSQIQMNFVLSQDMIADELIKLLSRQMFKCFVCQLRLDNSESQ